MPVIPSTDFLRSFKSAENPLFGSQLHDLVQSIIQSQQAIAQQTNSSTTGQPSPPPAINGLTVSAQNGHFQVAISDQNQGVYRGLNYFVEHADNPQFTDSHTEPLGPSRNANLFLGNTTRYFRAYSSYGSSSTSAPAYHGSATAPLPVTGGGSVGPPNFLASQGSGTGAAGVGLSGPGPVPFLSSNGAPPVR